MRIIIKNIFIFFILPVHLFSQGNGMPEVYSYKYTEGTYFYSETISLYPDGQFIYTIKQHPGLNTDIHGNWQKRDSCLILDSHPQRDKIIVHESFSKEQKGFVFNVEDKDGRKFVYHLYAILQNGDTLSLRDQFGRAHIRERISSFWITDTKGLKSPQYTMSSDAVNIIHIQFELQRVFKNEDWLIIDERTLDPRGTDGNLRQYYLIKDN